MNSTLGFDGCDVWGCDVWGCDVWGCDVLGCGGSAARAREQADKIAAARQVRFIGWPFR
jgi:hypothetical protein